MRYSVTITYYHMKNNTYAHKVYYWVYNNSGERVYELVSEDYQLGMRLLRTLEKKLGRVAELEINRYDRNIAYKSIRGRL